MEHCNVYGLPFLKHSADQLFWEDLGGPEKDLQISSFPEKDILQQWSLKGQSSAAASVRMTAWGGAEFGLASEEDLAAGWLKERWCFDAGHWIVYPSDGSA